MCCTDGADVAGIGVFDFGDMVETARVCNLCVALAYVCMKKERPLEVAAEVTAAYHATNPLTGEEVGRRYARSIGRKELPGRREHVLTAAGARSAEEAAAFLGELLEALRNESLFMHQVRTRTAHGLHAIPCALQPSLSPLALASPPAESGELSSGSRP